MSAAPVAAPWEFSQPTQAVVLFEDRSMVGKAMEMQDVFGPYEVHVYRWSGKENL